jgi:hypothetical protein
MAVTQNLTVVQNNLVELTVPVTYPIVPGWPAARPYNLTGLTVALVIKASDTASDGSGATYSGTILSAAEGLVTFTIPGTQNATAGTFWWRLDVIDNSGNHVTAVEGSWTVTAG